MQLNEQSNYPALSAWDGCLPCWKGMQACAPIPASTPPSRTAILTPPAPRPLWSFPTLIKLAQKHLKKLGRRPGGLLRQAAHRTVSSRIDTDASRSDERLPEQGAFQLGYYHQTQRRYTAKAKKEEQ